MDRLAQARGRAWRDRPSVAVASVAGSIVIAAVNAPAEAEGILAGMSLSDARTLLPKLLMAEADPSGDAAALHRLACWGERYTPWVAPEGGDGLFLDITGCAHLFGDEATLLADLGANLRGMGLAMRAAVADTPGTAWAVSHYGPASVAVVAPAGQRAALAPLPVASLRFAPVVAEGLRRLGLQRVGDLYAIPRAALAVRCGAEAMLCLDRALGTCDEPISPLRPAASHRIRIEFPEAIGTAEAVAASLDRLLAGLCRILEEDAKGGRRFELVLFRVDRTTQRFTVGTGRPMREPAPIARLFATRLDQVDIGFGIQAMSLTATAVERLGARQASLIERRPAPAVADSLADLVASLGNRLGSGRILRYLPEESHMPERSFRLVPAEAPWAAARWERSRKPVRPVRLLLRPEALEMAAGPAAEVPPAGFRWRRRSYRVHAAIGPERILPEWWHDDGAWGDSPRDYWRVRETGGAQFWVFRGASAGTSGRWFMHGLFH